MQPFYKNPYLFLSSYAWRNKRLFLVFFICGISSVLLAKIAPYLFAKIIDLFSNNADFSLIKADFYQLLLCMLAALIVSRNFANVTNFLLKVYFEPIVFKQMGLDCFRYINGHSIAYFSSNKAGSLAEKTCAIPDFASIYQGFFYYILKVWEILVIAAMLIGINIKIFLLFIVFVLFSVFIFNKFSKIYVDLRKQSTSYRNLLNGYMIDVLQNNFFVHLFNGFNFERNNVWKKLCKDADINNKTTSFHILLTVGNQLYFAIIQLLMIFYAFYLWKMQELSIAEVVLTVLLLQNISSVVTFLLLRGIVFREIAAELSVHLEPFVTPYDVKDIDNAPDIEINKANIVLDNVSFAYQSKKPLFKNFNLKIPAGQKVGIVGVSGSGKTTLSYLIQRFYDVSEGKIFIGRKDIAKVSQDSLRNLIAYVPQNPSLFKCSILKNIAYAKPDATKEEIIEVAKSAYVDEFIHKLPNGYDTIINEVNNLSGGQMQRVAIASALLKDAPIVIFDEATSSLDSESELYVQKAIEAVIKGKTVLAIAHRLSTLKNMDRIIVLENGKIVEDGTFENLISNKGKFYQFWELQCLKKD